MPFQENVNQFFQTGDFAHAASYDGGTIVNGHFDAAYSDPTGSIASVSPMFECPAADIPAAGVGKTLIVDGVTYTIKNRIPLDDGAIVRLILAKN